mmetsp:Transcript_8436/g.6291  ORF Transcript_8436/g.6291 Transcript_8436/m.6291 type:complete len:120 (-) Transcript_8436:597-956(-)
MIARNKDNEYADVPNRHEKLFYLGRRGKTVAKVCFQLLYLTSIVFLAQYIVFFMLWYLHLYSSRSLAIYVLVLIGVILAPLLLLGTWLLFVPQILTKLTIVTNIEMMKDKELVDKVVYF